MWKLKDYKGNEQVWYEAELIDDILFICDIFLSECKICQNKDCCSDCENEGAKDLGNEIKNRIQEFER